MQKIIPCLWFNDNAEEAVKLYASAFKNVTIGTTTHYDEESAKVSGQPESSVLTIDFAIDGYEFTALNGGPLFKLNPSISFMLNFDPSKDDKAREHLDALWEKLVEGGEVLMPLQEYPFSKHYGWLKDKFGVSWQFILSNPEGEDRPFIVPSLLFVGDVCGKAEEAIDFYVSTFKNSKRGATNRYPKGMEPDKEGTLTFADFTLEGQWFAAMDSAQDHKFAFGEATSFVVNCETQAELDAYWNKLSAVKESEQCGWLKDKFGVSWQMVPTVMYKMMADKDPEKAKRVMHAMLQMKKLDIAGLQAAYEGK